MRIYTVHAPRTNDLRAAGDRVVFVRDSFHVWAFVFGGFWLLYHRLWWALLGYVAVMAGVPYFYAGAWTAEACQKIVRFVDLAETFHLPVVYLADCPGFLIGLEAEKAATTRHGVRAMAAVNQTTVPWCTMIVRNAFGVAGAVNVPHGRLALRYAWLSAYWGSLPLEGGIEAAYRAEIEASADPAATLREIEQRLNLLRSPFRTAESFWVEEIIDPRDTRKLLCEFARLAEPLGTPGAPRFGPRP